MCVYLLFVYCLSVCVVSVCMLHVLCVLWQAPAPVEAEVRVWSTVAQCGSPFAFAFSFAHVALATSHMPHATSHMQQLLLRVVYGHSQGHVW